MKGSYVLCFDIRHMTAINQISVKAVDLAILEMTSRIDRVAKDEMLPIRIGGDEFALITGLHDEKQVNDLKGSVLEQNGTPFFYEGMNVPLTLWCGITTIPTSFGYTEFLSDMHQCITESKKG